MFVAVVIPAEVVEAAAEELTVKCQVASVTGVKEEEGGIERFC
jgi:hypothetical protein